MGVCGYVWMWKQVRMWVVKVEIAINGRRKLRMVGLKSWAFKHGGIMVAGFQQYED